MKRITIIRISLLFLTLACTPTNQARAQLAIAEVIRAGIKRVVKAVDLKVQRLQNRTVWLQNAQKTLENSLSKRRLKEISEWTQRQAQQYREHYLGFRKVRSAISRYRQVRQIVQLQASMLKEYRQVWPTIRKNGNFSPVEIEYMEKIYTGILERSLQDVEQIALVIKSFQLEMNDSQRSEMIESASREIYANHRDLVNFNRQNILLSIHRSAEIRDVDRIRKFYLPTTTR